MSAVYNTDFSPLSLRFGQPVLFRNDEAGGEINEAVVHGEPLKVVVYLPKGRRTEWRVPVHDGDRTQEIPLRNVAAAVVS